MDAAAGPCARLVATGSAQQFGASGNIGPLPDLGEALRAFVPDSNPGGPYTTPEGTNVTLTGAASTDPNGDAPSDAWDFDNDGFDDGSTQTVSYDRVGQDGSFTVRLRVTDSHGASDIDTATVNVTKVIGPDDRRRRDALAAGELAPDDHGDRHRSGLAGDPRPDRQLG